MPRSITSTAPAIRIFPDFKGSKELLSARNGISTWSISTTPSSGSRCLVRGHRLRVFERAAGFEIGGDAGRTEHMAAEIDLEPGFGHSQADHLIGIDAVHRVFRQPARLADRRAEEGGLAVVADAGRGEISSRTVRASDAPAFRDACRLSRVAAPTSACRRNSSPRCA